MENPTASSISSLPSKLDDEGSVATLFLDASRGVKRVRSSESVGKASKRAISNDSLVDSPHALVHEWIKQCEANHVVCNSERPEEFPKRLLDVGNRDCIRLCPTEFDYRYIALSHCWGNATPLKTTRANEMERKSSIPWEELPRLYQDAVKVTRLLGVYYLWIDSLCILQDDPDDWEKESAKMAGIYSGSYLVVAATCASSSDEGFLQCQDSTRETGSYYGMGGSSHSGSLGSIENELVDCPLFQRGWCFQELLLAPRVLHFAPLELIFHCRIGRKCECSKYNSGRGKQIQYSYYMAHLNPSVSPSLDDGILQSRAWVDQRAAKSLQHRFRSFKAKIYDIYLRGKEKSYYPSGLPNLAIKPVRFGEMWGDIVAEYTPLKFTFDRDILPALSGVANLTQAFSPGRYVAGLWEKDLHYQLAWESIVEEADCYRPSDYLAPSFSWASRIGPVIFPFERIITDLCTIVEVQAIPMGADPFGRVKDGHIKLRGKMIYELVTKDSLGWWRILNEGEENGLLVFDTTEDEAEMGYGRLHCFDLFREQSEYDDFDVVTALALHYSKIDDTFKRVGVICRLPAYWFDDGFENEIIII
jgi:hypothetical protein